MCAEMTRERAEEFGAAWNSGDADLVTSYFAENGVYHASVGPEALGKSYIGKDNIRRGVQAFFDRYPDGKFENLKVVVAGDIGTFEWDFVTTTLADRKCEHPAAIFYSSLTTRWQSRTPFENNADRAELLAELNRIKSDHHDQTGYPTSYPARMAEDAVKCVSLARL